ncbi:genetic suppressor element 1 isoform X2 [Danio rerio]|uniref:Genetic suppressor element 1 isoform X2 n=1 Tax=Danio rerio TaxID=7955 RepID=A0A8M3B788_DANRE|nr:genetic suppressor element 1-like isoform X2 [Danio rerio]|eukprot:XP_009296319.1 genetic suppressor element 1-like isoform X2 [Danio rerio]
MSLEPKSLSLGMISAAPCTMATVSPLTASPISGSIAASGSPASQSGFAAALRKLAKQAEEPRGSISSESSHVSSPVTNRISPVSTPKRIAMGTSLAPPTGTPPVVTIAPTKTVNGFWRSEGRQADAGLRLSGQERLAPDRPLPAQEKPSLSLPPYHPFNMTQSALMQDPRLQTHLSRQVPHMLLAGAQEEYVRDGFRPYASAEELRMPLMPLGLNPGTADTLAYFHSGYLPHPSLASYRMEDYYSLSALRSHYYQLPEALHPSAVHLPTPGVFYPPDVTHQALTALHSDRLQMEEELRQQERERQREKERTREIERERQWEQEVQREKEREVEIKKERAREIQPVKAVEKRHLSHEPPASKHLISHSQTHLFPHLQPVKERAKLEDRLTAHRPDKNKEVPQLLSQSGSYSSSGAPSSVSGFSLSTSGLFGKSHRPVETPMMLQRQEEDDRWLARQRVMKVEKTDRHGQEFQQQEKHHSAGRTAEAHREIHRFSSHHNDVPVRDLPPALGAPPPLITPRPAPRHHQHHQLRSPPVASSLWTPVSLLHAPSDRPLSHIHPFSGPSRAPAEGEQPRVSLLKLGQAGAADIRLEMERSEPVMGVGQRRLVSKLDLEEKKRREAREKGYYYDLDDSYDESDEEEVRAHLRRVAQQPPLKLDTSTEKTAFLGLFGLTTLPKRDEVLEMKRRKRRLMLQERSPSPPAVENKRRTPSPLSTRFTADEMNCTAELDDKKHFLSIFNLSHVNHDQRQKKKKISDLLEAIKQKTVTLDTLRYASEAPCSSPPATLSASSHFSQSVNNVHPEPRNHSPENPKTPPDPPPLAPLRNKLSSPSRRAPQQPLARPNNHSQGPNGVKAQVWERINPEEFAQHFHQSVLQSTHTPQQKHRGVNEQVDPVAHPSPGLQRAVNKLPIRQTNGHSWPVSAHRDSPVVSNDLSAGEGISSDEDEEEESFSPRWKGIESIFTAYEEYIEERSIEHHVLQSECRRLETQHYNLSVTAEQLSHSMRDLLAQKHNLALKRDRMQAELEHFKKCLALPLLHWHRGYYKGPSPR